MRFGDVGPLGCSSRSCWWVTRRACRRTRFTVASGLLSHDRDFDVSLVADSGGNNPKPSYFLEDASFTFATSNASPTPEPMTLVLFVTGFVVSGARKFRKGC